MNDLKARYQSLKARCDFQKSQLKKTQLKLATLEKEKEVYQTAHFLLTESAQKTREKFKTHVEGLVDIVLAAVFEDRKFTFELRFTESRNQIECAPVVLENGNEFMPKDAMGGSTLDIIGLCMRPILWSLEKKRSRPVFIMDEPARYVGESTIDAVGEMMSLLSHTLGIQFILITHNSELAKYGDIAYKVEHDGSCSTVSPIGAVETKKRRKIKRVEI